MENIIWVQDKGLHLNCSESSKRALELGQATIEADYEKNMLYIVIDGQRVEYCGDLEPLRIAG